jgi:hypothetical protein
MYDSLFSYIPKTESEMQTACNAVKISCFALAEFTFRRLGKHFYGTKRLWWDSVV